MIAEALTLHTNVTMTAPLADTFEESTFFMGMMNAVLTTIMCFLGILSFVLIYSLMLSDVEAKTYEYGMLRAMGFRSSHIIGMLSM